MTKVTLYSYWRSSAAWRVRIALHLKNIDFDYVPVSLIENGGQQFVPDYIAKNPMSQVPTLVVGDHFLAESVAIIEYLEEAFPNGHRLLPNDPFERAKIREIVNIVADDIHPIQNLRVVKKLAEDYNTDRNSWAKYWIERGFNSLESVISKTHGKYAYGNQITMADVFLVPQALAGVNYGVELDKFPIIKKIVEEASKLEPFIRAHPKNQIDAPSEGN